jgi:hypothetical protein
MSVLAMLWLCAIFSLIALFAVSTPVAACGPMAGVRPGRR